MRCPICEWDAPEQAVDCERCGRVLRSAASASDFAPPVTGLEQTLHPSADVPVETIAGLEPTAVEDGGMPLPDVSIDVERTQVDASAAGPSTWTANVEIERGREEDGGPRAPPARAVPEPGRTRERQLCPACFGRVLPYEDAVRGVLRCPECGVPLPLLEVV